MSYMPLARRFAGAALHRRRLATYTCEQASSALRTIFVPQTAGNLAASAGLARHRGAAEALTAMAAQLAKDRPRAYLDDFDVDDAYAQFKRASHFVESCDLKYALSSKKIDELGGGEILRLPELYANDFEWSAKGRCARGRSRTVASCLNSTRTLRRSRSRTLALCRGDRGVDKGSGVKLHYKGCPVHRVVRGTSLCRAATS